VSQLELSNSAEGIPFWQADSQSASQEIPRVSTRSFMAVFRTADRWPLSWARWIQSTFSHPISL